MRTRFHDSEKLSLSYSRTKNGGWRWDVTAGFVCRKSCVGTRRRQSLERPTIGCGRRNHSDTDRQHGRFSFHFRNVHRRRERPYMTHVLRNRNTVYILVLILLSLLLWLPRLRGPLDLRYDAGVYYILGTSLAEGKGYRLLNEPGESQ